jgi:predicted permease
VSFWSRLSNVFRVERVDRDLDDEQRFHLESRIDELVARGMTRDEAASLARRRFGSPLRARETSRDVKLLPWLDSIYADFRLGLRLLRKDLTVTSATVVSLALAMGACTAAFALVDALLLRPLPVRDPDRLVYLQQAGNSDESTTFSYPELERLRDAAPAKVTIFSLSVQSLRPAVLPDSGGQEEKLRTQFVSGNALDVLGIRPALGRLLNGGDDRTPGAHPVAVLSHAFWQRRLGGDRGIIGRTLAIERQAFEVVGVAEEGFTGAEPGMLTDIWLPNMMWVGRRDFTNPHWNWMSIWGRVAPGIRSEEAHQILLATHAQFVRQHADSDSARRNREGLYLQPAFNGKSDLRARFERPLLVLAAIAGLVLLIACSNVANLLLARGAARDREMALRVSIGAGRRRLLQQMLLECGVLAALSAVLGFAFATMATPLIVSMLAASTSPVYLDVRPGWPMLAFAAALASAVTILFGAAPAVRASSIEPTAVLAGGGTRQSGRTGLLRPLVGVQVGVSLTVVFVALLLVRSFDRLTAVDPGFNPDGLVLVTAGARERPSSPEPRVVGRQLLERVRQVAGVDTASLSGWALFRGYSAQGNLGLPGGGRAQTSLLWVSDGFFRTMRIPVLDGREFQPSDSESEPASVVIVNEAFAQRYFPRERAVGQRLLVESRNGNRLVEIVGVVGNTKDRTVRGAFNPFLYYVNTDADGTIQLRTSGVDPQAIVARLRDEIARVHPVLRVTEVTMQATLVADTLLRERLLALLSGFFAVVGLLLAAVGVYGVSSYSVVRRTKEIGIRLALGAARGQVVRTMLSALTGTIALGAVAGLALGWFFARSLRALLYEVRPLDPLSLALPLAAMLIAILLAILSPARRASRVNPIEALRYE